MLKILITTIFFVCGISLYGQFTQIPLATNENITSLATDGDTALILGKRDYFAKIFPDEMPLEINTGISSGNVTYSLQLKSGRYYLYSQEVGPYIGNVHESTNGGMSWPIIYSSTGLHLHLNMYDSTLGIFGSANGSGYSFTDDGINWEQDTLWGGGIASSTFYNDSIGIILTLGGFVHRTEDRGATWQSGSGGTIFFKQTEYITVDTIFSVGTEGGSSNPKFYYSCDSGASFNVRPIGYNPMTFQYDYFGTANAFYFPNSVHGYVLGSYRAKYTNVYYACIYETTDFGENWTPYILPYLNDLTCFTKVNDSTAYIGGTDGLLLKWDLKAPLLNYLSLTEVSKDQRSFSIYPNPSQNSLNIEAEFNIEKVVIFDLKGAKIVVDELCHCNRQFIDISALPSGLYFIRVEGEGQQEIKRLVKL